jgi:hypothetical protein
MVGLSLVIDNDLYARLKYIAFVRRMNVKLYVVNIVNERSLEDERKLTTDMRINNIYEKQFVDDLKNISFQTCEEVKVKAQEEVEKVDENPPPTLNSINETPL